MTNAQSAQSPGLTPTHSSTTTDIELYNANALSSRGIQIAVPLTSRRPLIAKSFTSGGILIADAPLEEPKHQIWPTLLLRS